MESDVRILLADDHPIVRQGLRRVIDEEPHLKVVAEASDGRTALEQIEALRPKIAVLDIDMPVLNGFDVARAVRDRRLPVAIIFLTVYREESFFDQACASARRATSSKTRPSPTSSPASAPSRRGSTTRARR